MDQIEPTSNTIDHTPNLDLDDKECTGDGVLLKGKRVFNIHFIEPYDHHYNSYEKAIKIYLELVLHLADEINLGGDASQEAGPG